MKEKKMKEKKYSEATKEEKDRITAIVGYCVGKVMEDTLIDTTKEILKNVKKSQGFEEIRRLVANHQIVYGDSPQLQAIYEICNDNLT